MHPFGGVPYCPRCGRAVYAAEQIMGPGRMLYHKVELLFLYSLSLMEHDKEPYCKQCYTKNFGPRDLRQANLPHRDDIPLASPSSPVRPAFTGSPARSYRSTSPTREEIETEARFERAKRGPPDQIGSPSQARALAKKMENLAVTERVERTVHSSAMGELSGVDGKSEGSNKGDDASENKEEVEDLKPERGKPGIPRTIPLTPTHLMRTQSAGVTPRPQSPTSPTAVSSGHPGSPIPVRQNMTGTRYGAALTGGSPLRGSPWANRAMPGTGTPLCARCSKAVYFAEQVKANGKVFHKPCLRCTECNTALDSSRLAEKGEKVVCRSCYSKFYGPQGSGYALLGKAGA
ncbi:hypothetical protein ACEPAF_8949 [Sanghuangporus sanghuang]|uniref:LIM-domain-containing protein n=1 Tax=Sanghuangporus baumii TaxID=108892 RepID=A0A9Q5HUF5_SANBA|nr:LIM-domain-containing protein [Sanghuangporus baumii]